VTAAMPGTGAGWRPQPIAVIAMPLDGSVQCINCEIATALGYMVEFRERAQGRPKEKAP
jgi:hypothetical protein